MRSETVVIVSVGFQDPTRMRLATDDCVIETLATDRSDQPFSKAILPGRGRYNRLVADAHRPQSACDDGAIDPIAVPDHVTRSPVPRKSLGDLACDPLRRRVGCDVDPDEISALNPYNHEAIQQFEVQWSGPRTDPWRQCPERGFAERSSTPDSEVHVVSPCTWRRLIERR